LADLAADMTHIPESDKIRTVDAMLKSPRSLIRPEASRSLTKEQKLSLFDKLVQEGAITYTITETLKRAISNYGDSLYSNINRIRDFLFQSCPTCNEQIGVLLLAIQEGLVAELKRNGASNESLSSLSRRLQESGVGFDNTLARWAIEAWAEALHQETAAQREQERREQERIQAENARREQERRRAEEARREAERRERERLAELARREQERLEATERARRQEQERLRKRTEAIASWNHYFINFRGRASEPAATFVLKKLGLNLSDKNAGEKFIEKFWDSVPQEERQEHFITTISSVFDGYQLNRYKNIIYYMTNIFDEGIRNNIKQRIQQIIADRSSFQKVTDYTKDQNIIQRVKEIMWPW
jgi:flagellar biosynthesis GTPase FlhF